jgi:hypothetical protein
MVVAASILPTATIDGIPTRYESLAGRGCGANRSLRQFLLEFVHGVRYWPVASAF